MAKRQYRTQFFRDMDSDTGDYVSARIRPESNNLVISIDSVGFTEEFCNRHFADADNPYKNPAMYRQMLREQSMIRARKRAGLI